MLDNLSLRSDGSGTWTYLDLDLAEVAREWGPHLEAIRPHTDTKGISANADWKLVFWVSYDERTWDGPTDLCSAISANGYVIQADYTTTSEFGLRTKYGVGVRNSSGTAVEGGSVSAWLAFRFQS